MLPMVYQDPSTNPSCCDFVLLNGSNSCAYDAGYETDHAALSPRSSSDGAGWESEGDNSSVGGYCAADVIRTMQPARNSPGLYLEDQRQTTSMYALEVGSPTFHRHVQQKISGEGGREVVSNDGTFDLGSDIRGAMMEGMDCCVPAVDQHSLYPGPMHTDHQMMNSVEFCTQGTACAGCYCFDDGVMVDQRQDICSSHDVPCGNHLPAESVRDTFCNPTVTVEFINAQDTIMYAEDWKEVEGLPCCGIENYDIIPPLTVVSHNVGQIGTAPFKDDDCASYLRIDDDEDYWSRRRYSQKEAERVLGPVDDDRLLEVGANGLSLSPAPTPIPPDTPPRLYDLSSQTVLPTGMPAEADAFSADSMTWTADMLLEESSNGSSALSEPSTPSMDQASPSSFSPRACARDYICRWTNCWLPFEGQTELVNHIEAKHVEGKARKGDEFVCFWEDCPRKRKAFNARYKLLIHMRVHSGEKPNKCQHPGCTQAFSRLENLKIHMRSHTGERPYLCQYPECPKAFSNSSDRAKHQRTHIDTRPYACTYGDCGKRYTDPSSLRKHMKNHPNTSTLGLPDSYSSHYPMSSFCDEDYSTDGLGMNQHWQ